jgi:hypothetical protein
MRVHGCAVPTTAASLLGEVHTEQLQVVGQSRSGSSINATDARNAAVDGER